MTIKHLPGKHNQKLHASRQSDKEDALRRISLELRRKEKEAKNLEDALKKRSLQEILDAKKAANAATRQQVDDLQQRANAMGIKTPTPIKAINELRKKYGDKHENVHSPTAPIIIIGGLTTKGFEAVVLANGDDELYTNILEVGDPDKAEAYIKDFVETARSNNMVSAVFNDLPIDLGEDIGGVYKMSLMQLANMTTKSFAHLRDTYGFEVPKEFAVTTGVSGRTTMAMDEMDVQKVANWINSSRSGLLVRLDATKKSTLAINVANFHNVKHPSHPDVPLFTEYIYHSNNIPNTYVDLR